MNVEEFVQLTHQQAKNFSLALQALWYDYKGDWHQAHEAVQDAGDKESAWVHAYLHRKEGDLSNARYWYRRSGKPESGLSLSQEWQQIAQALLRQA